MNSTLGSVVPLAMFDHLGRPRRLIWCPIGGLFGGCGARAVSRKTPIYFIYLTKEHLAKYVGKLYIWQDMLESYIFDKIYLENYIFDLLTVHCRFSRESGPGARTLPKIQSSKKHSLKHKDKCKYKYKTCVCILQNPANPALTCWFLLQVVGRPAKERKWFSAPLTFVFFVKGSGYVMLVESFYFGSLICVPWQIPVRNMKEHSTEICSSQA